MDDIIKNQARHLAHDGFLDDIQIIVNVGEQNTIDIFTVQQGWIQPCGMIWPVGDMD